MTKHTTCCDTLPNGCRQGRDCPVRKGVSAIFEGYVDGMPRIKWCGKPLPAGTALYAAAPQVDAVQAVPTVAWLIEWTGPDGTKYSEIARHNAVGDYYYVDENATATELVPRLASPPHPLLYRRSRSTNEAYTPEFWNA